MSFLAAAIVVHDDHHADAAPLYERLVDEGTTVALCPTLTTLEFRAVLGRKVRKLTRLQLEEALEDGQRRLREGQLMFPQPAPSDPVEIRRFFFDYAERLLQLYLGQLRRAEFRLTKPLLAHGRECMVLWGLNSQDGVMMALAETAAAAAGTLPHMATYDKWFRKVDHLQLWGGP